MSRLPEIAPEKMSEAQRRYYDEVTNGPRGGGFGGPFAPWLHSPELAEHVQRVGAHLRYGGNLPGKIREFTILTVARFWKADYEWYAHAPIAVAEGLDPDIAEAVRLGRRPTGAGPVELAAYDYATALLSTHKVEDAVFRRARERLGEAGIVELTILIGYYSLVATTLNAFDVGLPSGEKTPFDD